MRNILIFLLVPVIILLVILIGGKWENPNYGPGEWLTERFPSLQDGQGLEIGNVSTYEHLIEPVITVYIEDDLMTRCGQVANGCAIGNAKECNIYVGERAKASTMAHEIRHCHGWAHGPKRINGHYQWYPKPHLVKP